jgi:CBS domain-containing protein
MARHTVNEFTTDQIATVSADVALIDAAKEMLRHRVHRFPVVEKKGTVRGIISTMDVLTAFVEGATE